MDLALETRDTADVTVITAKGELNLYTSPRLREMIRGLLNTGHYALVLDIGQVEYLDSTGWAALVGAHKRVADHDGDFALAAQQEHILRHLAVSGLASFLRVYATVEDAAAAITGTGVAG